MTCPILCNSTYWEIFDFQSTSFFTLHLTFGIYHQMCLITLLSVDSNVTIRSESTCKYHRFVAFMTQDLEKKLLEQDDQVFPSDLVFGQTICTELDYYVETSDAKDYIMGRYPIINETGKDSGSIDFYMS